MAKFKVGDKVRILDGSKIKNYAGTWSEVGMRKYVGQTDEINKVYENGYSLKGNCYTWDERGLELDEKIVIERHGNKVVAKYGSKVGVARCSPEDEFDFKIGADIAFSRLIGCDYRLADDEFKQEEIKVGDKVRVIGNSRIKHHFPIGNVVEVKNIDSDGDLNCVGKNEFGYRVYQILSKNDVEKVTDTFDWDGFKAKKFFVKCTKDNFDEFVTEAKKHGCTFKPDENLNPFTCGLREMIQLLADLAGHKTVNKNEIIVNFEDGRLKVMISIMPDAEIVTW